MVGGGQAGLWKVRPGSAGRVGGGPVAGRTGVCQEWGVWLWGNGVRRSGMCRGIAMREQG